MCVAWKPIGRLWMVRHVRRAFVATWLTGVAAIPALAHADPPELVSPEETAATELLAIVGDGFRIKQTDHFTIAYDTTYEVLRALSGRLEGTHKAVVGFCEAIGRQVKPLGRPLRIILFDDHGRYTAFCREAGVDAATTAGFYHHDTNLAVFCNTFNQPGLKRLNRRIDNATDRLKTRRKRSSGKTRRHIVKQRNAWRARRDAFVEATNRLIIQHEATHQILFNIGVHVRRGQNPGWLTEGIACQFEVPQARAAYGIGRVNHFRLADLRDALKLPPRARNVTAGQVQTAMDAGRLLSMRDIVSDPQLFSRRGASLATQYAQAWALVFYLRREKGEQFAAFVARVAARAPNERLDPRAELAEFESFFGSVDAVFQPRGIDLGIPGCEGRIEYIDYAVRLSFDPREAGR